MQFKRNRRKHLPVTSAAYSLTPLLNPNPTCHSTCWKHHVRFWPKSTTLDASGKLFHTLNKSSWSYKTPKGKAVLSAPCIVGCLLPNLRPLKGQHNERHGCEGHLTNVKSPGHMKGERENPRRPPLSSLTADLSKLALSPPPWHVWNVCYVLSNWKQRREECGEGGRGSSCKGLLTVK